MTRARTRTRARALLAVASTAAVVLLAVACGSDGGGTADSGERPTITIVTYSSYVLDPEVERATERELGVEIEVSAAGDGAEALSAAILTAGNPEGDVFFGVDNALMGRAAASGVFEELDPGDLPDLSSIPAALQLDDSGTMVPVDVGPVCVDYDRQWFEERSLEPPASFEDLADPRYRDLLVVESPVTSTPGLIFLLATHAAFGDDAGDYWRRLVANGVSVAGSWDDAWYGQYTVGGGDRPLVVSYASSPPAEVVFAETPIEEPRSAVVTATCADQIEFAAVLAGTDHPAEARAVVNAMLGERWQASLPLANFVYPAREGVEVPEVFARFAPRPADAIQLDPATVDEHRDAWIDEWRQIAE